MDLAAQLPASVLADLLGLRVTTATRWTQLAGNTPARLRRRGRSSQDLTRFATSRAPVEEARARHLAGTAYARTGDQDRSEQELDLARTACLAAGATWLASTVDAERRRHTGRSTGVLTRRERQIAELVATGLTNQEIAARLVLSRRTVESHLSHIFPKLNVRTRSALVHHLASEGAAASS